MSIRINKVDSELELAHVFEIRREVFVVEQDCPPELEWEFEEESTHFLARLDELPVGAARWRKTEKGYKLERFAVAMAYRGKGVGEALVAAVLADLPNDASYVYLHAQVQAMGLYRKFGFEPEGPQFEEAGIQHFKMVLKG
jgi:predicted GNAT family N-acyltransferase